MTTPESCLYYTIIASNFLKPPSTKPNEPPWHNSFTFRERVHPNPQPEALGTNFEARVRDYMAAHTERMESAIRRTSEKKLNEVKFIPYGLELITSIRATMAKPRMKVDLVKSSEFGVTGFSIEGSSNDARFLLPKDITTVWAQKKYVDAHSMFAAIKARFGGNEATKKVQKAMLKQQYENFNASCLESLNSIFNRLQKLVSRLAIMGVVTPPEDLNIKFLRSLPAEWDTHMVVWMNKPDFDTIGLDDLYNNFKIVEQKVKKSVGTNNDDKNLAFLTTSSLSSTNTINTVNLGVSTGTTKINTASTEISTASFSDATVYAFLSTQPQGSQLVHEDLEQLHDDDLEEMDLKWNMALLSMRARKFYQRTGRKIIIDGSNTAGYDKSKVECFNCHKMGHFARECRAPRSKDNRNWNQGSSSKAVKIEDASEKAMCAIDGGGFDWSDMAEEEIQANMALMAFTDSEVSIDKSCSKSCLKNYEALKKQYDDLLVKLDDTGFKAATYKRGLSILEGQVVKYKEHEVLFSEEIALLKRSVGHKEYQMGLLRTELEKVKEEKEGFEFKIAKFEKSAKDLDQLLANQITDKSKKGFGYNVVPSPHPLILNRPTPLDLSYSGLVEFKQPKVNEYGPRDSSLKPTTGCDKESENSKENTDDSLKLQHKTVTETSSVKEEEPKKARENTNAPIIEDWVSEDEEEVEPIPKVEKKTDIPTATKKESVKPKKPIRRSVSCPKHMVPRAVLMKTGLKTVNNARPVNTVRSVNTGRPFSTARARGFNVVKPSACWVWRPIKPNGASLSNSQLNDKGFVDSGCSRHMTGNIAHLSDFKDFDGGYVTFGGGAYGGRISGKGTIKTDNLDFDDVYFVKELKFNLFSVSQMCDKKNYVLFTDSECLVLSPNFKLPDENQILLKIPRQDNMYSFDMKNIVPKDGLTCLVAKATSEESMLWHRRLGHVNFKNINKLVKENLVRDLPLKRFENDQTCVACLKGKQHRASFTIAMPHNGKPECIYFFYFKQFWRSAEASIDDNGEVQIIATIDGHSMSITEASLRRHLKLDDQDDTTSIPNSDIFEQLALMGYHIDSDKLTFQKGAFSPQWRFLIHNILHCFSPKKTA
ncbi:ribonuclease H-like domain-containing protein [Tanacetum coccineum]